MNKITVEPAPDASVLLPSPSNLRAAAWIAGWLLAMLLLLIAGREATHEVSVFQVMEIRSAVGLLFLYPFIIRSGGLRAMKLRRPMLQIGRNVIHYIAQYLWFLALTLIPIAQVVSIEFTMPIWTAIFAAFFLKERITRGKTLAIVLGLGGVLVIVRPGITAVNSGQIIMLIAAMGFGTAIVMMKSLTKTEHAVVIIFWMLVIQSAIGLLPAIYFWARTSTYVWLWLIVVAFAGTYSHYCMTQALRYADATIVVPMDFLRVPLSALVGWLVYAERLDAFTGVGVVLILSGNLLNLKKSTPSISL